MNAECYESNMNELEPHQNTTQDPNLTLCLSRPLFFFLCTDCPLLLRPLSSSIPRWKFTNWMVLHCKCGFHQVTANRGGRWWPNFWCLCSLNSSLKGVRWLSLMIQIPFKWWALFVWIWWSVRFWDFFLGPNRWRFQFVRKFFAHSRWRGTYPCTFQQVWFYISLGGWCRLLGKAGFRGTGWWP